MTDPAPHRPSAVPSRGPHGDAGGDVAAAPAEGHARRALALILPFAQLVPPILPALGIGHGVGTMSAAASSSGAPSSAPSPCAPADTPVPASATPSSSSATPFLTRIVS